MWIYIYILFPRNILNVITRDYSNFIDYKLFAIRIFKNFWDD